jgi:hypothetical protein
LRTVAATSRIGERGAASTTGSDERGKSMILAPLPDMKPTVVFNTLTIHKPIRRRIEVRPENASAPAL